MKKLIKYFIPCITIALFFVACRRRESADIPTATPPVNDVPVVTETPTATETPVTPSPVPTSTPVPVITTTPFPTESVTMMPTSPAETSKEYTFDFSQTSCLLAHSCSYSIDDEGALSVTYDTRYGQLMLALPQAMDMALYDKVTVRAKSEYGMMSVKLFDEAVLSDPWAPEVFVRYDCVGDGVVEYTLYPELSCTVWGIGIMGVEAVEDYSAYTSTVYSVTFHRAEDAPSGIPEEYAGVVTEDMTLLTTYGTVFDYIGTAVSVKQLRQPAILDLLKKQYNSITLENDMKAEALFTGRPTFITMEEAKERGYRIPENYKEETVPVFFFEDVEDALEICGENGLGMRSVPLLWHSQTPTWFFREGYSAGGAYVTPEVMDARLEFYIRNVMGHVYDHEYGEVVYAWDVVNEYLHSGVNDSDWLRVYGDCGGTPTFVKLAFRVADEVLREYGLREQVTLLYNDYNTFDGSMPDRILALVEFINADGVICDGVGMQAHMDTYWPLDRSVLAETAEKFLAAGLAVHITELDITINNPSATSEKSQQDFYVRVFRELLELKKNGGDISSITFWGMADNVSWRREASPLLFSDRSTPKKAYYEVLRAFREEK